MRERGMFINAPDIYFDQGANKMMFYGDPTNFGQPRRKDIMLSRQMLFDATYVLDQELLHASSDRYKVCTGVSVSL